MGRIGIVGWAARTGLGYMYHDMWRTGFADEWLVVSHPKLGVDASVMPPNARIADADTSDKEYGAFLDSIDILVFCERPVAYKYNLVQEAKRRGIVTCCIPMMEWLPPIGTVPWLRQVDVMWAPTRWSKQELQRRSDAALRRGLRSPWFSQIQGGRWGVNLDRFPFVQRTRCDRFLFCNGFGGAKSRKGIDALRTACAIARDVPVLLRSQRDGYTDFTDNVELLVDNAEQAHEIYAQGDILLAPSRFEGLGLQLYEAQACGLPVLTTAGSPMSECRPMDFILGTKSVETIHHWSVMTYEADPEHLAELMLRYHGLPLGEISAATRESVAEHYDLRATLQELREVLEPLRGHRQIQHSGILRGAARKGARPTTQDAARRRKFRGK